MMTREQFGQAYEEGHEHTVRFLLSRGVNRDTAADLAQSAWLRGWERLNQLRDDRVLITWVNTIALNQFRRVIRRDKCYEPLQDTPTLRPALDLAALDLATIMSRCRTRDRALLNAQLEGVTAKELSQRTGASATAMRLRLFRARTAARIIAEGGSPYCQPPSACPRAEAA
jgi:DNA-directed RNA polymerase specialized sigma24 family protein